MHSTWAAWKVARVGKYSLLYYDLQTGRESDKIGSRVKFENAQRMCVQDVPLLARHHRFYLYIDSSINFFLGERRTSREDDHLSFDVSFSIFEKINVFFLAIFKLKKSDRKKQSI